MDESEARNACAVPWNDPVSVGGAPSRCAAALIASTAWPSE
jgi:hypothetical protein